MSDDKNQSKRGTAGKTLHGTAGAHWAASRLIDLLSKAWAEYAAQHAEELAGGVGDTRTAASLLLALFKGFEGRVSGSLSEGDGALLSAVSALLRTVVQLIGEPRVLVREESAVGRQGRTSDRWPALSDGRFQAKLTRAARVKATKIVASIPDEPIQLGRDALYEQLLLYAADLASMYQTQRRLHARIQSMEEMAKLTEKAAAAGLMSGGILHDVNHYLTVIQSAAEMLPIELGNVSDEVRGDMDAIAESAARAGALVHRFQYLSKPGAEQDVPFSLGDVVLNARALLRRQLDKRGIKLVVELGRDLPAVVGDPAAMEEVVINLLSNAIEVLKSGGMIRVAVDAVAGEAGGRDVALLVQDNGPGVPPELQGKIFEPFVTGREGGTGLGLYLVRQIVERHSGSVRLFSTPGKGARFLIRIPAAKTGAGEAE